MRYSIFVAILVALIPAAAKGHGYAFSDNFIVHTPDHESRVADQRFAELILRQAETFRREFSTQWLGGELPNGAGESVIYVALTPEEDRGLTWAKDHPNRTLHNVYLRTNPENAAGSTLHHEMVHTILATKFPHPHRLPSWIEEGIASRYDDNARCAAREQLERYWVRTGQAPSLAELMATADLRSFDDTSYAAATSVINFLLTRGDEHEILRFAVDGQRSRWSTALQNHYGIDGTTDLQSKWLTWLTKKYSH